MITFKSTEDLSKLPPTDTAYPAVKDLVDRLIADYTWEGQISNPTQFFEGTCTADHVGTVSGGVNKGVRSATVVLRVWESSYGERKPGPLCGSVQTADLV